MRGLGWLGVAFAAGLAMLFASTSKKPAAPPPPPPPPPTPPPPPPPVSTTHGTPVPVGYRMLRQSEVDAELSGVAKEILAIGDAPGTLHQFNYADRPLAALTTDMGGGRRGVVLLERVS